MNNNHRSVATCLQLARRQPPINADKFIRVGKPDADKECFGKTKTGDIHAWQAKYFTSSFTNTQWAQID